jgi:hypothetical protein
MKTFQSEFTAWLGERTDQEGAEALGIGRSTVNAYRLGTREPSPLALPELRSRMAGTREKISSAKTLAKAK